MAWILCLGLQNAVAWMLCLGLQSKIVLRPGSCVWPAHCCGLDLVSGPAVKESPVLWPGSCVWACSQGEYSLVAWILCLGLQSRRVQCCGLDLVSGPTVKESTVLWPGSCVWACSQGEYSAVAWISVCAGHRAVFCPTSCTVRECVWRVYVHVRVGGWVWSRWERELDVRQCSMDGRVSLRLR